MLPERSFLSFILKLSLYFNVLIASDYPEYLGKSRYSSLTESFGPLTLW